VLSSVNLYRGSGTKRYTLYVCVCDATSWGPSLSPEHDAFAWVPAYLVPALAAHNVAWLHPWLQALIDQHPRTWARLCAHWRDVPRPRGDSWSVLAARLWAVARVAAARRGDMQLRL
jgi:hypothetical protein